MQLGIERTLASVENARKGALNRLECRPERCVFFDIAPFILMLLDKYRFLQQQKLDAANVPELSARGVKIWKIPTTVFSDTILIWANDNPNDLDIFLTTCSVLIANSVQMGWPIRGGIAYGQCYLSRKLRIFVGPPIVDAYETEGSQEWIGAAFHQSCLEHTGLSNMIKNHDCVAKYNVPVKPSKAPLEYAIHWADRLYDAGQMIRQLMNSQLPEYHEKYQNTLLFIEE